MAMPNIATRTGDSGKTDLWSGERVSKTDPRIGVVGEIDYALSALGKGHKYLQAGGEFTHSLSDDLIAIQRRFVHLMGEVCTSEEKKEVFRQRKQPVTEDDVAAIDACYDRVKAELDRQGREFTMWKMYGQHGQAAAEFYFIRGCFRRAELMLWDLRERGFDIRDPLVKYVNRVSDLLYYIAVLLEA